MEKSKIDIFAIEKVISTHPAIEKAVVTVDEKTDELEIIAYYIATGNPIDIDNLRQFLKNKIDSKLIPQKLLLRQKSFKALLSLLYGLLNDARRHGVQVQPKH